MVPVYPKIRLSAQDLTGFSGELLPFFQYIAGQEKRDQLTADLRFCLAGECLEILYKSAIPADRLAKFVKQIILSRYVGFVTFSTPDGPLAHVIYDSTDMRRAAPAPAPLLAILLHPPYELHVQILKQYKPGPLIL
jgi:hypothetical protein